MITAEQRIAAKRALEQAYATMPEFDAKRYKCNTRIYQEVLYRLLEKFGDLHGKRVADVGAGRGILSLAIRLLGAEVTAVEKYVFNYEESPMFKEGDEARVLETWRANGIQPVIEDIFDLDRVVPSASFDALVNVEVIEHVKAPKRLLDGMFRALRPGGVLIVLTPNYARFHARLRLLFGRNPKLDLKPFYDLGESGFIGHWREYLPSELAAMLTWAGFTHVRTWTFWDPLYQLKKRISAFDVLPPAQRALRTRGHGHQTRRRKTAMKIVYVENVRIPSERAHAYQIVQTCAWLSRLGHDVTLVNPDRAGGKDVFEAYGLPKDSFHHERIRAWDPLTTWPVAKALAYNLQRWAFTRALRKWVAKMSADAWYTRDVAMIDALKDVVKGPWILESHDSPDADAARWERVKPFVTGHIAISQGMKERLKTLGVAENRILVAQDGYDPKEFATLPARADARVELGLPAGAFVAMYAGSFYPWKGVDLAVRSWDGTPENWHLVLIGGPAGDRERIKTLVPSSVRNRVHLFETCPRNDLVRMYPAANVGLQLSSPDHEIANRYTSPLKQFEYLAAGLPVIASDVPSSHEVLNDSVARFFSPTRDGFLSALKQAAEDAVWQTSASAMGEELVRPYAWENRAKLISTFIASRLAN
jgi:glycosyltransferase involved in cell wall biosynthesis/2-polyprenyl-3-methyl-5-hydroxy-6-metoxy-1,4-benzoquinol methylase